MDRRFHWRDYITINIYWLGLSTLAQTMAPLVLPLLVERFAGPTAKGTAYGTLRLWALMVALLTQSLMGMLSDRHTSRWGRRRPFIAVGTVGIIGAIVGIGLIAGMDGAAGYGWLMALYLMMAIASNTAQGAQQGLIPDLVPSHLRGRFSATKAILELPLPTILVALTIAPIIARGRLWSALGVLIAVLVVTMLLTLTVREPSRVVDRSPIDWRPLLRLALMTAVFTIAILAMGKSIDVTSRLLGASSSLATRIAVMGTVGLVAIALCVGSGVWAAVRIGIGSTAARRNPSFTWWVVNRLAYLVGATNLSTFAIYFMQARLGLVRESAAKPAAYLMMVIGFFILAAAYPSGWLADRFPRKTLVAGSGLLATAGTLIAMSATGMAAMYVGGCLIGIATGVFYTANWALGTELVPRSEAGRYLGISNLAGAGAGAIGAYIGGPIADYFTLHVPEIAGMGYVLLFGIYALLFLLSVVALGPIRMSNRATLQEEGD